MIYGIGVDLVKTARVKEAVEKWGDKFLNRIYTKDELAYCNLKQSPYLSLAVRFAAKEAMIKAIGPGAGVSFLDIEVMNDKNGKPSIVVGGRLKEYLAEQGIKAVHLSLSHERDYGVANVVVEG